MEMLILDVDKLHNNDNMTANIKYLGSIIEELKRIGKKIKCWDNSKMATTTIISKNKQRPTQIHFIDVNKNKLEIY